MERGHADFTQLEVLVLDEADRMLDMGFAPDVKRILNTLPDEAADDALLGHHLAGSRRLARPRPERPRLGRNRPARPDREASST